MCAVPNMAAFCSSLISCFPSVLLRYCMNDCEMVPGAVIITAIYTINTITTCSTPQAHSVCSPDYSPDVSNSYPYFQHCTVCSMATRKHHMHRYNVSTLLEAARQPNQNTRC